MLEEDAIRFDTFLKENDKKAHEAIKKAERETKVCNTAFFKHGNDTLQHSFHFGSLQGVARVGIGQWLIMVVGRYHRTITAIAWLRLLDTCWSTQIRDPVPSY